MKIYLRIISAVFSLNLLFQLATFAQAPRNIIVTDEFGNTVPGASVTIGEGTRPVLTDEKGVFALQIVANVPVLIEKEGFESQLIPSSIIIQRGNVTLQNILFQLGAKDKVSLPFVSIHKRLLTGSVTSQIGRASCRERV